MEIVNQPPNNAFVKFIIPSCRFVFFLPLLGLRNDLVAVDSVDLKLPPEEMFEYSLLIPDIKRIETLVAHMTCSRAFLKGIVKKSCQPCPLFIFQPCRPLFILDVSSFFICPLFYS